MAAAGHLGDERPLGGPVATPRLRHVQPDRRAARCLLDGAEQAARIARHAGDGTVGRLAVGFVPAAVNGVLPDMLPRYRPSYPG